MNTTTNPAPGAPGNFSPWTSGAKTGIGRALNAGSHLSFTIGKGVVNEVYFPREDTACIRQCGFIVTGGAGFFSDECTDAAHQGGMIQPGIPFYELENVCRRGKEVYYRLRKDVFADPQRVTLLQRVRFQRGDKSKHRLSLYVFVTPHLHNSGAQNDAWVGEYKGMTMLFASGGGIVLAMACDIGWANRTVGFIGTSEGLADLRANGRLTAQYDSAGQGNVQLCAAPALSQDAEEFMLAIGFGNTADGAAHQARSSLLGGFAAAKKRYVGEWSGWQRHVWKKGAKRTAKGRFLKESTAVLCISESRSYPGGIIASLAIPWGEAQGINEGLGYHLVWPRDLVESAWGFLALGANADALRILNYIFATQEVDGHWPQNMWLDGCADLTGLQLDQVALPILLLDSCHQEGLISKSQWRRYGTGLRKAVDFILQHGPMTEQDRWEQQPGLSVFTVATEVAALVAAAALFEDLGDDATAALCRRVADDWNCQIEDWTYVRDTETAKRYGVEGYYVRINPILAPIQEVKDRNLAIRHRYRDAETPIGEVISGDALALVRFGLRRPDDPRILNTIKVIDGELKHDLPAGPCWRRFTKDAYGEDDEGHPFVKSGCGRCWPLLTGERAHYEIAAGNLKTATALFRTMEDMSHQGMLPEQVWDGDDLPQHNLYRGRYTGSAMPLTWAQAEYLKLAVSLRRKKIFDMPAHTRDRYLGGKK